MRRHARLGLAFFTGITIGLPIGWLISRPSLPRIQATTQQATPTVTHGDFDSLDIYESRRATEAKFGVHIIGAYAPIGSFHTSAKEVKESELLPALAAILPELNKYPKDIMRRIHIGSIIICSELKYKDQAAGAFPDFSNGIIYMTTNGYGSRFVEGKRIHHEMFHVIEEATGWRGRDDGWSSLNPPGFKYDGPSGRDATEASGKAVWTDGYPGFVSSYSKSAAEEDRAELFAWLMLDPARVRKRCESDSVLSKKVEVLLSRLDPDLQKIIRDGLANGR